MLLHPFFLECPLSTKPASTFRGKSTASVASAARSDTLTARSDQTKQSRHRNDAIMNGIREVRTLAHRHAENGKRPAPLSNDKCLQGLPSSLNQTRMTAVGRIAVQGVMTHTITHNLSTRRHRPIIMRGRRRASRCSFRPISARCVLLQWYRSRRNINSGYAARRWCGSILGGTGRLVLVPSLSDGGMRRPGATAAF